MLRWIVILLAGGRACYTGWLIIASLMARSGMESGMGFGPETLQQMAEIPALPLIASIIYTLGYLFTAILVLAGSRRAVPVAIFAAALDIAFWAFNATNPLIAYLSQELDWGAVGTRDMVLNLAAIAMVVGTLRLRSSGHLR